MAVGAPLLKRLEGRRISIIVSIPLLLIVLVWSCADLPSDALGDNTSPFATILSPSGEKSDSPPVIPPDEGGEVNNNRGTGDVSDQDLRSGDRTGSALDGSGISRIVSREIISPPSGHSGKAEVLTGFVEGDEILFKGVGFDIEEDTLEGKSLNWTSSIDGVIGTGQMFRETNLSTGEHLVVLTVIDSRGATGSDSVRIVIEEVPEVSVNKLPVVEILSPVSGASLLDTAELILEGSAMDEEDGELSGSSLKWSSDVDGSLGSGKVLDVTGVLSVGIHTITLRATDSQEATQSSSIDLTIEEVANTLPVAEILSLGDGISLEDGIEGLFQDVTLVLKGSGMDEEDGTLDGASLVWSSDLDGELGNGSELELSDPLSIGTHTLKLIVTDSEGAIGTDITEVTIEEAADEVEETVNTLPVAEITTLLEGSILEDAELILEGTGTDAEDGTLGGTSLVWSCNLDGELGTGSELDLSGQLSVGAHTITLTVTDSDGATGTDTIEIIIEEVVNNLPVAEITTLPDGVILEGTELILEGTGTDAEDGTLTGESLSWTSSLDGELGTGNNLDVSGQLSIGTHTITLTVTDSDGATGTDTIAITVEEAIEEVVNTLPVAEITTLLDVTTLLEGAELNLEGTGTDAEDGTLSGASLVWSSSLDGELGIGTRLSTTALSPGEHTITLTATDSEGASGVDSLALRINAAPIAEILTSLDGSILEDTELILEGSGTDAEDGALSGAFFFWSSNLDGELGTGSELDVSGQLSVGTHTITLTVTDSDGATGTDTIAFTIEEAIEEAIEEVVNSLPVAEITTLLDGVILEDTDLNLEGTGTDAEDGILSGESLSWTSNLDGELGTGNNLDVSGQLSIGTHIITLTVRDSDGATSTDTMEITVEEVVNALPVAEITTLLDVTTLLEGADLNLEGIGTDAEDGTLSGASLVWSSNLDGQLGTGTSLSTTALSTGEHTITLTAIDRDGATGTDTIAITIEEAIEEVVNTPPAAEITTLLDGVILEDTELILEGTGTDAEDGALSGASLVWSSSLEGELGTGRELDMSGQLSIGTHIITLTVTDSDGATGTDTFEVTVEEVVNALPVAEITTLLEETTILEGVVLNLEGAGTDAEDGTLSGASLVWSSSLDGQLDTGTSLSTTALTPGEHTITLTATDSEGVSGADNIVIRINAAPVADILTSLDGSILEDSELILEGTGTDGEDGTLSGASLVWSSNLDGQLGTGAEVNVTDLLSVGTHTITLTVTDSDGATATDTIEVTVEEVVNALPVAEITTLLDLTTLLEGTVLNLEGIGTDAEDGTLSGASLVWSSSLDGQLDTGTSLSTTTLLPGEHTITLTATDSEGASGADNIVIRINAAPAAEILTSLEDSILEGAELTLEGSGSDAEDGTLSGASLVWSSSLDGQLGTGAEVNVTNLLSIGTHTITLTVTDSDGATGTDTFEVTVEEVVNTLPVAEITTLLEVTTILEDAELILEGTGVDAEDGALSGESLSWTSSLDGELGTGNNLDVSGQLSIGTHIIILTVRDSDGATSTDTMEITVEEVVNALPAAEITTLLEETTILEGVELNLEGTGTDAEDGALSGASLVWSSSLDGQLGTGTSLSTTSLSPGEHTITLTATDSEGASDTDSLAIRINAVPVAEILTSLDGSILEGAELILEGKGTDAEDGTLSGASLVWSSNLDGELGTGTELTTALSIGTHIITLKVTDSDGATGTDTFEVTVEEVVNAVPVAEITTLLEGSILQGTELILEGTGTDAEDGTLSGASLVWSSSLDGDLGTGTQLSTTTLLPGEHTITLTATDSDGASGADSLALRINAAPVAEILTSLDGSILEDAGLILEGSGTDAEDGILSGESLSWTSSLDGELGTGNNLDVSGQLSIGTHIIILTVRDSDGATSTDTMEITVEEVVNALPVAEITTLLDVTTLLEGAVLNLEGIGTDAEDGTLSGASLVWSSNLDGQLGTGTSLSTTSLSPGEHTITLTATDSEGASDTDSLAIRINAVPVAEILTSLDGSILEDVELILEGTGTDAEDGTLSGASLVWSSDRDGQLGTGRVLDVSGLLSIGTHTITLTVTDSDGATSADTMEITVEEVVNALPVAEITTLLDVTTLLEGAELILEGTGTDAEDGTLSGASLVWSSSLDGDLGTGTQLSTTTLLPGEHTITLTVTDSDGASGADNIVIRINAAPVAEILTSLDGSILEDAELILEGKGTDAEDGTLSAASLVWSSSLDGELGTGSELELTGRLSIGIHTLTLRVTDSDGASTSDNLEVTVEEVVVETVNTLPEITISHEKNLLLGLLNSIILFGDVTDAEDGELTGESLVWTNPAGEKLGTGVELVLEGLLLETILTLDSYQVTLTATDSDEGAASDSVDVVSLL